MSIATVSTSNIYFTSSLRLLPRTSARNFRHTLHVLWLCQKACRYYQKTLTPRQMRNLLIAALFHDFDHPGHPHPGEQDPDRINIRIAIAGLRRHITPLTPGPRLRLHPAGVERSPKLHLRRLTVRVLFPPAKSPCLAQADPRQVATIPTPLP